MLPFWIAALFGWSTGGIAAVWGETVWPGVTWTLHGLQVLCFYVGLYLLWPMPE